MRIRTGLITEIDDIKICTTAGGTLQVFILFLSIWYNRWTIVHKQV